MVVNNDATLVQTNKGTEHHESSLVINDRKTLNALTPGCRIKMLAPSLGKSRQLHQAKANSLRSIIFC